MSLEQDAKKDGGEKKAPDLGSDVLEKSGLSPADMFGYSLGVPGYAKGFVSSLIANNYLLDTHTTVARSRNEGILARGAASSLSNAEWRASLKTRISSGPMLVANMVHMHRGLAPWNWRYSAQPPGADNVDQTDRFRSIHTALQHAGVELSGPSHSLLKSDKHETTRAVYTLYSEENRRWLSWLREGRCVLALREFSRYVPIFGSDGAEVNGAVHVDAGGAAAPNQHFDFFVRVAPAGGVAAIDPTAQAKVGIAANSGAVAVDLAAAHLPHVDNPANPRVRRDSISGVNDPRIRVEFPGSERFAFQVKVVWQDSLGAWTKHGYSDGNDDSYFVSRATRVSECVYDLWAVYVDAVRVQMRRRAVYDEITVVFPNIKRPSASEDEFLHLLSTDSWFNYIAMGLVLAHQRVATVGTAISPPACNWTSITGRDLFALVNHLTVTRIRNVLPVEGDAQMGVANVTHALWRSPLGVRLAAAFSWVTERASPHGLSTCYVPSGPQLDRMLRFQAVRLGMGFDMCIGLSIGTGQLAHHVGPLGALALAVGKLLFNTRYGCADGVATGWWADWELEAEDLNFDPTDAANPMIWGLRRKWMTFGLPIHASDEWNAPCASDSSVALSALDPKSPVLEIQDGADSSRLFRATLLADCEDGRAMSVTVNDSQGDTEKWAFDLRNVRSTAASAGHHWFGIPAAILKRKKARRGVVSLAHLTRAWWPDNGLWVLNDHSSVGSYAPHEVDSDDLKDF